ncbi:Hypothetical protein CINCED_3A001623, partial [Cinara cedri]
MLVIGAAAAVGSVAGAAAGAAFASTQYEKVISKLEEQNKNMSENCDKQVEATKKENKKLTEKLADLTTEVSQAKEEAKKKHQELISKMEQERKEMQAKMDRDAKATQAKIDMLLSFLNIHPALQPASPSHSGAQTVTEGLSGATGTQSLHGANDHMSTSQFSIVADFSDDDIEVMPDQQAPSSYVDQLKEQKKGDLTVIDSMTLENTLKLLELKSLLSDLDDNLRDVKKGKKSIEDHRKYFKTEVDNKLKNLSLIYHPDSVQRAAFDR